MVVDDNKDAADTLRILLGLWGHDSQVAYDGQTGLQVACDYHPDCLLVDLAMPGMNGYTLARRIRKQPGLQRAKLIALTVHVGELFVRLASEAGFDDYFVKPTHLAAVNSLKEMLRTIAQSVAHTKEVARLHGFLATKTQECFTQLNDDRRAVKQDISDFREDTRELSDKSRDVGETGSV